MLYIGVIAGARMRSASKHACVHLRTHVCMRTCVLHAFRMHMCMSHRQLSVSIQVMAHVIDACLHAVLPFVLHHPASCRPSLDPARQLSAFPGPCPPVVRLSWTLPASCPPSLDPSPSCPPSLDPARHLSAFPGPCPPAVRLPWTLPTSCPPSLLPLGVC